MCLLPLENMEIRQVRVGRRAEHHLPVSCVDFFSIIYWDASGLLGEESKQFCFVLINTQEVFPVLWQCSGWNHSSPDSLPSLLSGGSFQTVWDVDIPDNIKTARFLKLGFCLRHKDTVSIVLEGLCCTRIQHLDHSCTINEHSINHRSRS